jgi:hypothetical protein
LEIIDRAKGLEVKGPQTPNQRSELSLGAGDPRLPIGIVEESCPPVRSGTVGLVEAR